jgi:hypothetical protein
VSFHGFDMVTITAKLSVGGFTFPPKATIRGYLVPDDAKLRLNLTDARAAGVPLGNISRVVIEWLINPIVDLSALPVPARITGASIENNVLTLTASGSDFVSHEKEASAR